MGQKTRQWILENPPHGDPVIDGSSASTFKLQTVELPELGPDQVLLKAVYISNDPAQRTWIDAKYDPARLYTEPVTKGQVMRAYGVLEVVESKAAAFTPRQMVVAMYTWSEYVVLNADELRPVQADDAAGLRLTHFIGALGLTGLTAYYGLEIVRTTKDDAVVVSGAAGAVGSMVVQIAKHIFGCKKIIGIAGGEKKCRWVESLGADICVDYKAPTFKEDLWKATEGFVEVYFDNVGGEILDLMLNRVKRHGRIAACGTVSLYNSLWQHSGLKSWTEIVGNRLEVRGFIITDAMMTGQTGPWLQALVEKVMEGKIKIGDDTETVVPTPFEDVPKTWMMLFSGANQGKLVTAIKN